MIRLMLICAIFCSAHNSFAQLEKVMHQTFSVDADMSTIDLDLTGDYEFEYWAGSSIMTETKVELYESSPAILNHFVEEAKRYEILADTLDTILRLHSLDKKREPIRRSQEKECPEIVNVKIFVPEDFEASTSENKIFIRKKKLNVQEEKK